MPGSGPEMPEIIDTNVLVRFFVGDVPFQQKQAAEWFRQAEKGKKEIMVSALVVAETIFVLESFYRKKRQEIADAIELFLSQRWLAVPERDVLLFTLGFYRKKKHFVDCYLAAWALINHADILTFDKKLQKLAAD